MWNNNFSFLATCLCKDPAGDTDGAPSTTGSEDMTSDSDYLPFISISEILAVKKKKQITFSLMSYIHTL